MTWDSLLIMSATFDSVVAFRCLQVSLKTGACGGEAKDICSLVWLFAVCENIWMSSWASESVSHCFYCLPAKLKKTVSNSFKYFSNISQKIELCITCESSA